MIKIVIVYQNANADTFCYIVIWTYNLLIFIQMISIYIYMNIFVQ